MDFDEQAELHLRPMRKYSFVTAFGLLSAKLGD